MRYVFCFLTILIPFMTSCSGEKKNSPDLSEIKGVWITNVDSRVLESQESIREAVDFLYKHGFNTLFPVVWNQGKTMYPSKIMEEKFGLLIDPVFEGHDPLKILTDYAHKKGFLVIPWFEFGFSSSYNANGGHILAKYPHWAAKDRDGNLLTKNNFEWMNPYHPEVQDFIKSLILEVVENYNVDGIQGDDRLPANPIEGGYSDYTINRYKAEHNGNEPPYDYRDPAWQKWRGDILNAFAEDVYKSVKAVRRDLIVSWAPNIYPWAYDEYLQDWPAWIKGGYCDLMIPQIYRYNIEAYKNTLKSMDPDVLELSGDHCPMIPGVLLNLGKYTMDDEFLRNVIAHNRESGYNGEVFFFYEGLRKENDRTAKLLKEEFYK